jgi:putative hydrolase of the HAD superfamily
MRSLRALLIDAHGTLLALEPPAPALRAILRERFDVDVSDEQARAAFAVEIAYYRGHLHEGRDPRSVASLRARCAGVLATALGVPELGAAGPQELTAVLLDSLVFRLFDDALPALIDARRRRLTIVVVSNWDASLPDTLGRLGVLERVDGVVASAAFGAAKPAPALFVEALRLAGCAPSEAVHVGDTVDEDVIGARAAGVEPLLLARGAGTVPTGVGVLRSLAELGAMLDLVAPAEVRA